MKKEKYFIYPVRHLKRPTKVSRKAAKKFLNTTFSVHCTNLTSANFFMKNCSKLSHIHSSYMKSHHLLLNTNKFTLCPEGKPFRWQWIVRNPCWLHLKLQVQAIINVPPPMKFYFMSEMPAPREWLSTVKQISSVVFFLITTKVSEYHNSLKMRRCSFQTGYKNQHLLLKRKPLCLYQVPSTILRILSAISDSLRN